MSKASAGCSPCCSLPSTARGPRYLGPDEQQHCSGRRCRPHRFAVGQPRQRPSRLQTRRQTRPGGQHAGDRASQRQALDLKPGLTDQGYAPSEGFWSTRFVAAEPGLYTVSHTCDKVVSYAPVRSIKSAKTCFVASGSLDNVSRRFRRLRPPAGPSRWNWFRHCIR